LLSQNKLITWGIFNKLLSTWHITTLTKGFTKEYSTIPGGINRADNAEQIDPQLYPSKIPAGKIR
jgi:hypothetical protein